MKTAMSNPFAAPVRPMSRVQTLLAAHPLQPFQLDDVAALPSGQEWKKPEEVKRLVEMSRLDLELRVSINLDARCFDKQARQRMQRGKPVMASSPTEGLVARRRDANAVSVAQGFYDQLVLDGDRGIEGQAIVWPFSKDTIRHSFANKVMVSGGAHFALNRILEYYPKKDGTRYQVVTAMEAAKALQGAGLGGTVKGLPRLGLTSRTMAWLEEGEIRVNPNSDNGFPYLGKMSDAEPREAILQAAANVRLELEQGIADLPGRVRWLEERDPLAFLFRGKAKQDVYSAEKVLAGKLRFYHVAPRPHLLVIQQASQVVEAQSVSVIGDASAQHVRASRTVQGASMTAQGPTHLVQRLDELAFNDMAYVHCGDDSWVVVTAREGMVDPDTGMRRVKVICFALDCSSFDLTQHATVTLEVHRALRDHMQGVDPVSAALWYHLMRERSVTIAGGIVARMKHGGASGMPLQSKVNDMLMDVLLQRVRARYRSSSSPRYKRTTRPFMEQAVAEEGAKMGFKVRLENYQESIQYVKEGARGALAKHLGCHPFLFVGYYFYNAEREYRPIERFPGETPLTRVFIDVPRFLAQLPYPNGGMWQSREEYEVRRKLALAGVAMSAGWPSEGLAGSHHMLVQRAIQGLEELREHVAAADVEFSLGRFVFADLLGQVPERTVEGLMRALERDNLQNLWGALNLPYQGALQDASVPSPWTPPTVTSPEREMVESRMTVGRWADEVENQEEQLVGAVLGPELAMLALDRHNEARGRPQPSRAVSTAAASSSNVGRPPPGLPRITLPLMPRGPRGAGDKAPRRKGGRLQIRDAMAEFLRSPSNSSEESWESSEQSYRGYDSE